MSYVKNVLGCARDAPLWFWNEGNPGYNDYLLDFVETFAIRYLHKTISKSSKLYE